MRIIYNDGYWTFNENYANISISIIKESIAYDERGGNEITSRLYVDDQPIIITDTKNYNLLEKLFYKIARFDDNDLYYFDINEEWNKIIDTDILKEA